ncbi:MAG: ribbon-helix-helix protein, CopG family [Candidatus Bathyarchaeota archaeon]|nr:ribbon-helix-helix protein, CopG family [Candidatus Termiticorpusculum sp.]
MQKKEKWVVFREEEKLVRLIDNVAEVKGINRSAFIREATRKRLVDLGFLSEDIKNALELCQVQNDKISIVQEAER